MKNDTLGYRITELLNKRCMTQRELAIKTGIAEVSISRYINNKRMPKGTTIVNIANTLNVTTDYLLLGVEPKGCCNEKQIIRE